MVSSIVIAGQLGTPYGTRGWLKARSFTDPKENILQYFPWHIYRNQKWEQLAVKDAYFSSNQLIVHIEGCLTPEEARRYTNAEIGIYIAQLPLLPPGEYYWSQLVGLQVVTIEGVELGIVDSLMETGSNDVLVVKGDKTRLIPYLIDRVIQKIDLSSQRMIVDWDPEF